MIKQGLSNVEIKVGNWVMLYNMNTKKSKVDLYFNGAFRVCKVARTSVQLKKGIGGLKIV